MVGALLLAAACIAALAAFCVQTIPQSFNGQRPNDFPNYYFAGQRLWEGRPVYRPLADDVCERLGFAGYPTNVADSPFAVIALSPLAQLPYRAAFLLLYAFSLLAVPAAVLVTAKALKVPAWVAVCLAGAALLSNQYRFLLLFNHMESILLWLLVGGWLCLRAGRGRAAAVLWGAAAALKLFPALLFVLLAAQRRWRLALWGGATAAALTLLGALIMGIPNAMEFVTEVIPFSRTWLGHNYNISLMSIGARAGGVPLGWAASCFVLAGVLAAAWRAAWNPDRLYVAATAAMLLLSPLSWIGYGVVLLPTLVIAARWIAPGDAPARRILLAAVVLTQFWPFQASGEPAPLRLFLFHAVPPAAGYALLLLLAGRQPANDAASPA